MEANETPQTFYDVRAKLLRYMQKDGVVSDSPTMEEALLIDSAAWFVWMRENKIEKNP